MVKAQQSNKSLRGSSNLFHWNEQTFLNTECTKPGFPTSWKKKKNLSWNTIYKYLWKKNKQKTSIQQYMLYFVVC